MDFPLEILNKIDIFLLVFIRVTGIFVVSPIFGRKNLPTYLKIGFAFMLALIMVNFINVSEIDYSNSIYGYILLVFKEFIVGLSIGFISYVMFSAIYLAGQLIDMQIGFGMVNVLDPVSNIQIPITSNFYFIISMLVFLAVNGHLSIIKAVYESYNYVKIGGASLNENLVEDIIRVFGSMFVTGFKIAAPITAAILISDVALGVLAKTVPQLNVFVVGMPLKIFVGLIVIMTTMPMFIMLLEALFNDMNSEMFNLLEHLGQG